jgi:hypothetical protein
MVVTDLLPNPSRTDFYVRLNIARYVFSRSKLFEHLENTLPLQGAGLALRSREASLKLPLAMNEGTPMS